ncbi:hypothetical protein CASFOL_040300 [Castilleja foliolosa]
MDTNDELKSKFMEFPYVSASHKNLMLELLSSVDTRLGPSLQSCTLPPDVQHFGNPTGSARASLHLRSGLPSSQKQISSSMVRIFSQIFGEDGEEAMDLE